MIGIEIALIMWSKDNINKVKAIINSSLIEKPESNSRIKEIISSEEMVIIETDNPIVITRIFWGIPNVGIAGFCYIDGTEFINIKKDGSDN